MRYALLPQKQMRALADLIASSRSESDEAIAVTQRLRNMADAIAWRWLIKITLIDNWPHACCEMNFARLLIACG
ncbi:hypothetical protein [Actinomadura viridis]|uniref:Uncharacterized protein n=1 Tax=Actinomadura viridis TaxID=58110 RepID=A0A931GMR5_9ACTN|nr:hypothetical protein [Actinomadura viridis]MBG6093528.1 hypothetical protein [Actinomadura viridis]